MTKSQQQISFIRYGGYYYTPLLWENILQFLGIGKYYNHWKIGKIYVPSDMKFGPSTKVYRMNNITCRQYFNINTLYRLIKITAKMLSFAPILCVHDDDVKNGEKIKQIHCNYRFADENTSRNPIGEKINLKMKTQIPVGYSLYEERNYYYRRMNDETDRAFKSRKKNNFVRKKKPKKGNAVKLYNKTTLRDVLK